MKPKYDVVILGAGHNGLVAAAYLARAGLSVLLLEKNDYIGGASMSQKVFPDYDAYLSRYSYLVSLFPEKMAGSLLVRAWERMEAAWSRSCCAGSVHLWLRLALLARCRILSFSCQRERLASRAER
jgi:phytoene dehydrogenase-like protein